jgi:hypothetical protein
MLYDCLKGLRPVPFPSPVSHMSSTITEVKRNGQDTKTTLTVTYNLCGHEDYSMCHQ